MVMTVGNATTMRAWVLDRPAPVETSPLRYVPKPVPAAAPGELLVRVLACAVCRTDLHVIEGDLPPHRDQVTPGHMVVGTVAALGDGVADGHDLRLSRPSRRAVGRSRSAPEIGLLTYRRLASLIQTNCS